MTEANPQQVYMVGGDAEDPSFRLISPNILWLGSMLTIATEPEPSIGTLEDGLLLTPEGEGCRLKVIATSDWVGVYPSLPEMKAQGGLFARLLSRTTSEPVSPPKARVAAGESAWLSAGEAFVRSVSKQGAQAYWIYTQRAGRTWELEPKAAGQPADSGAIERLQAASAADRHRAATSFLCLPFVQRSWYEQFVSETGFVQYRDGKVPRVRKVELESVLPARVELSLEIQIYNLFTKSWVLRGKRATLVRGVVGEDLECLAKWLPGES